MEKELKKLITDEEMFALLNEAGKLYENYLEIQKFNTETPFNVVEDNYMRDINHPLNLNIKG